MMNIYERLDELERIQGLTRVVINEIGQLVGMFANDKAVDEDVPGATGKSELFKKYALRENAAIQEITKTSPEKVSTAIAHLLPSILEETRKNMDTEKVEEDNTEGVGAVSVVIDHSPDTKEYVVSFELANGGLETFDHFDFYYLARDCAHSHAIKFKLPLIDYSEVVKPPES